jgi:hypothetical protein
MVPLGHRAEEQTVDDAPAGKVASRLGHFEVSNVGVAPGTGGISAGVGRI